MNISKTDPLNLKVWTIVLVGLIGCLFFVVCQKDAAAQTWPLQPVRLIVPFPAGGGTDIVARSLTQQISSATKWTFLVDNKPGSGGNLGIDAAAKSQPDGYTLVLGQTSNLTINPTLYSKLPYDPIKDLTPISLVGEAPLMMAVASNSPYRNLSDLVKAAKAAPGDINYATSGNGTVAHLATELFQRDASIKLTHVPYKGASQGLTDLLGGQVQLYISSVPTLIGHIKSGKLRALAVTSQRRVSDLPDVPTVAESGYKEFEAITWFGVLGPAKLPASVLKTLNTELVRALKTPELQKKLADQGVLLKPSTSEQFSQLINRDMEKWGRLVKDSGAKAD
jgi:tripartite-type tricarboxylate transporter receptor subunit TctC